MKSVIIIFIIISVCKSFMFAQDSAKVFSRCEEKVKFAVEKYSYYEKTNKSIKEPKVNPAYEGGVREIKIYFEKNQVQSEKAKQLVLRAHISFLVNCKGEVCEYKILDNESPSIMDVENEILEILKKMPAKWKPATDKAKLPVDCYQVITFTVYNGVYTNIFYK